MSDQEKDAGILFKSLEILEWPGLCAHLRQHALSPLGAALCEGLLPEASDVVARQEMALTSEMAILLTREGRVPLEPFGDLRPLLQAAERGERLSGAGLRQVGGFLGLVQRIRGFLQKRSEHSPLLADVASVLEEAASVRDAIMASLDPEGQVREEASPRLRGLRREARRSREALLERLDGFVRDRDSAKSLQDAYFTVREGRFVLPVRGDARGSLGGIVHDISASGATYFVEPQWLVEMNNALRIADLEVQKEVERILDELSQMVSGASQAIHLDQEAMARLDLIHAKASFSLEIRASEPGMASARELTLRGLRHPLLALRKISVVPNDLFLDPDERILVVSGPNAGGKTVLLKAVGLASLMARAGLHIPAEPGSRVPPMRRVLADIGDQQDLRQDVSTFSGHMRNLRAILNEADDSSLVILDELAGSTDPQEGASLALAILEALQEKGVRVLVTTHYPPLKAWAQGRPGVRNAAMGFDLDVMAPTYRLHMGLPGQSSALEIARRMGLPHEVLASAAARLKGEEISLEQLLKETERQRSALEEDRRQAAALRSRLEDAVQRQEETLRGLREERESFLREKRRRLSGEIQEARRRIEEALQELRKARRPADVEVPRAAIREVEEELRPEARLIPRVPRPLGEVGVGNWVEVLPLGQRGILLEDLRAGRGRVRVQVGPMEVLVEASALGGVEEGEGTPAGASPPLPAGTPQRPEVPPEIDLRGMRVEDALDAVEQYLDQALLGLRAEVRIIHGHGTGALKQAIRQWLSGRPWVAGHRPGGRGEGGDGATVVSLRSGE
jgi:DNA mismatch repair protein MutS2